MNNANPQGQQNEGYIGHTPRPWSVYDDIPVDGYLGIDAANGAAVVYFGERGEGGIPRIQDARLIAAAPELLHACQEAVELLFRLTGLSSEFTDIVAIGRLCEEAIAKAQGAPTPQSTSTNKAVGLTSPKEKEGK